MSLVQSSKILSSVETKADDDIGGHKSPDGDIGGHKPPDGDSIGLTGTGCMCCVELDTVETE